MRAFGRDEVKKIIAKAKGYIDARREKPRTGRGSTHDLRLGRQALPFTTQHVGCDRGTSATAWLKA